MCCLAGMFLSRVGPSMAHDAASVVDAVREQHEADLLTLKREYASKLESFAGEILDHYLSGESWETAFAAFFAEHCHKFAQFSPDDGFELRMTEVHNAFLQMMDGLLDAQLLELLANLGARGARQPRLPPRVGRQDRRRLRANRPPRGSRAHAAGWGRRQRTHAGARDAGTIMSLDSEAA